MLSSPFQLIFHWFLKLLMVFVYWFSHLLSALFGLMIPSFSLFHFVFFGSLSIKDQGFYIGLKLRFFWDFTFPAATEDFFRLIKLLFQYLQVCWLKKRLPDFDALIIVSGVMVLFLQSCYMSKSIEDLGLHGFKIFS